MQTRCRSPRIWLLLKNRDVSLNLIGTIIVKVSRYLHCNRDAWRFFGNTYQTLTGLCIRCTNHLCDPLNPIDVIPHVGCCLCNEPCGIIMQQIRQRLLCDNTKVIISNVCTLTRVTLPLAIRHQQVRKILSRDCDKTMDNEYFILKLLSHIRHVLRILHTQFHLNVSDSFFCLCFNMYHGRVPCGIGHLMILFLYEYIQCKIIGLIFPTFPFIFGIMRGSLLSYNWICHSSFIRYWNPFAFSNPEILECCVRLSLPLSKHSVGLINLSG